MLPWKHEVCDSEAIPGWMIKEPVAPTPVVNENHDHQTQSIENKYNRVTKKWYTNDAVIYNSNSINIPTKLFYSINISC